MTERSFQEVAGLFIILVVSRILLLALLVDTVSPHICQTHERHCCKKQWQKWNH